VTVAGLTLNSGLGASVFANGYPGAAVPDAAGASPQGPTTIGQKAFGIVSGGDSPRTAGIALISAGTFSLLALAFIYWSLPR
jgi:hypothetical protein